MDRRTRCALLAGFASAALAAPALVTPATASTLRPRGTIPSTNVTWCTSPVQGPCIVSASDNGAPVAASDNDFDVSGSLSTFHGDTDLQWGVSQPGSTVTDPTQPAGDNGFSSMSPAEIGHSWSIEFDLGTSLVPRATGTYADNVTVKRQHFPGDSYDITITGDVVKQAVNAECDTSTPSAQCPVQSGADIAALQGEISDFGQWDDTAEIPDFYGLDSWTNVEYTETPPTVSGDPFVISTPIANSYKFSDGDVVHGFYHVIIPNKFLQDMGVDDPSTLQPAGIDATVGTGTVKVTPGDNSTAVDATNVTFAPTTSGAQPAAALAAKHARARTLKVKRGTVTPTRPTKLKAQRSGTHVVLTFAKAQPRGSRLTGYRARCVARHASKASGKSKHSQVKINKLVRGKTYACQVRAKSKAGHGAWSKKTKA